MQLYVSMDAANEAIIMDTRGGMLYSPQCVEAGPKKAPWITRMSIH